MRVPFNYLPYQFRNPNKIISDWRELIRSTEFTIGPFVEKFEYEFAKFIGAKYCVSTNSGTDALILSLKSLGLKKGDEVITVANTFYATVGAIVACNAKPVFVDCNQNYQIDETKIESVITSKTKIIIPVHWGGASPNIKKIKHIAKKNNLIVLEDACMGIGAKVANKSPGTFGKIGVYSMHPLKSLNVMGDGGMIVTNDKKIFQWLHKYRNHGMLDRDHIEFWGVNSRLQPLQAIVASNELKNIPKIIKQRNINANYLDSAFLNKRCKKYVKIPIRNKKNIESYSLYMALFEDRDVLIKYLNKNKIEAKIHYKIPLHLQQAAKKLKYSKGSFPEAEKQAAKLITLPVHQFLKKNQLDYMIEKIFSFYNI